MKNLPKSNKGFTLIEVIVVLAVISIMAAVLTPMTATYVNDAKLARAASDTKTIALAIQTFNKDLREWPIWVEGSATKASDAAGTGAYDVLSSVEGDDVSVDDANISYNIVTDRDSIDHQLMTNDPTYDLTGKRKWIGPYMQDITDDPWGNKYYVNVEWLQPAYLTPGSEKAVFVISAGPNEMIETDFTQLPYVFSVGGDDIIFRIK